MISLKKLFTPVKSVDSDEAKKFMTEHTEGSYTLLDVRQAKILKPMRWISGRKS